ncbi:VPLPA-CTERM sorting domain-containing protein [bacterium]|nr:VPLPA-CTERM sorting domain-containing protein [bacterium]
MNLFRVLSFLGVVLILPSLGRAATLTIANFDFETGGLADNSNSASPGVIPTSWQAVPGAGPSGSFYGYYNPVNDPGGYTTGVTGSPGITGTMSGPNVFYFGSATNGQGIQQTLSSTFSLSTDYTLTVARGTRNSIYNNTLRMQLFAGSTLLTSRDVAPEPVGSRGTFLDYSTSYIASVINDAANTGLVGQSLMIRFLEIDNPGNPQAEVDIDNVRLNAVPEPASGMLLVAGLAALAVVRRRRA